MARVFLAAFLVVAAATGYADEESTRGMPFGPITDADIDHLQEFAKKKSGFDLKAEMKRVYCCDKEIDEDALARVFNFSLSFKAFDKDALAYGQIIFSSFLNIGEVLGVEHYTQILDRQPPEVRQRIRDFFFYPYSTRPANERDQAIADVRKDYPTLFPKNFQFAHGDPLFVARDYPPIFSFTIAQDTKTKNLIACVVNVSPIKQQFLDSLSDPAPAFAFRCQFGKREPSGDVSSISEELTLNTAKENYPIPPVHLSTLAPGDKRASVISREVLVARVLHALASAPQGETYDSVRFIISLCLDDHYSRFMAAKSPFLDLADYRKAK
jgi:hypothetical protein